MEDLPKDPKIAGLPTVTRLLSRRGGKLMNRKRMSVFVATIIALLGVSISSNAFADFTVKRIVRCDKGKPDESQGRFPFVYGE